MKKKSFRLVLFLSVFLIITSAVSAVESVSGGAAASAAALPVIDDSSVETTAAALVRNATVTVTPPETYTTEMKQKVIQETALAYYYHNPDVQYDGRKITDGGELSRHLDFGTPEMAAPDSPVYSVCSNYTYKTYYEGFRYKFLGKSVAATIQLAQMAVTEPTIVYKYGGTDGETDLQKALTESRKVLLPGDVITGYGSNGTTASGHSMLFVGDIFGDGKEYVLHCWGKSYTKEDGIDYHEDAGSIKLQTVEECCYTQGAKSPQWYLGQKSHSSVGFTIYRPMNDPNFPAAPTASGAMRLVYPRMEIRRELDRNRFMEAQNGEEITVTVTVTNHSTQDYLDLPIVENLPAGQTFVEGSASGGVTPENGKLQWLAKIPAGKTLTLTYRVRMDAALGETVTFPAGTVGGIPSRETALVIGGKPLSELQQLGIYNCGLAMKDTTTEKYEDLQFVKNFYKEAIGVNVALPQTVQELLDRLTKEYEASGFTYRRFLEPTAAENEAFRRMVMPLHLTGSRVLNDGTNWSRVREYRAEHYKTGDVFIGIYDAYDDTNTTVVSSDVVCIYLNLGNDKVLSYEPDGTVKVDSFGNTIGRCMRCKTLLGLRPTLASEEMSAPYFSVTSDNVTAYHMNGLTVCIAIYDENGKQIGTQMKVCESDTESFPLTQKNDAARIKMFCLDANCVPYIACEEYPQDNSEEGETPHDVF